MKDYALLMFLIAQGYSIHEAVERGYKYMKYHYLIQRETNEVC